MLVIGQRNRGIWVFRPLIISPPVTSPQPKVISLHNRSHFVPCKSHFAPWRSYFFPCKKLVKFVVNFSFLTDFELNTMAFQILTNAASSRVRLNTLGNTKYGRLLLEYHISIELQSQLRSGCWKPALSWMHRSGSRELTGFWGITTDKKVVKRSDI